MATIKGTIVCFGILFLAISWPGESLGAPSSGSPLLKQYLTSDRQNQQTSSGSSSCNCNLNERPSASGYQSPSNPGLILGPRQQLLNQAQVLIKQLASPASVDSSVNINPPCNSAIETQERILLQSLVNRLGAFQKNSVATANPSSSLPVISEATYNSIVDNYLRIRLLTVDLLNPIDAQIVQPALDSLYKTFVKIITGQLLNVELPNLCSVALALNTQLNATDAPTELQEEITDFIESLTEALTGQNQVTILGLCSCLNDLETSVVSVVENDKSLRLQYLLSSLVEAVTKAVVSGGDVGCNVIDIVQRYVASIKQAVQEDADVRATQIYQSVLSFEEELHKVLVASKPTSQDTTSSSIGTGYDSQTQTDTIDDATSIVTDGEYFVIKERLVQQPDPDGKDVDIVQSGIYKLVDPKTNVSWSGSYAVQDGTIQSDPNGNIYVRSSGVYDVNEGRTDSTTSGKPGVKKQANFDVEGNAVMQIDENGNNEVTENGKYSLTNPVTGTSKSGNFVVENSVSTSKPDGSIEIVKAGRLSVDTPGATSPSIEPSLEPGSGYLLINDHIFASPDSDGNLGNGTYNIKNPETGEFVSGTYVIQDSTSTQNPDGSVDSETTSLLYVDGTYRDSSPDDSDPILYIADGSKITYYDHLTNATDQDGDASPISTGVFGVEYPNTGITKTGNYVFQNILSTDNPDGSTDITRFGRIFDINFLASSINSSGTPKSSSTPTDSSTLNSAKNLPITKESFQALVDRLTPVRPVQPGTVPSYPSMPDPTTSTTTGKPPSNPGKYPTGYDATSIIVNGMSFITEDTRTPVLNSTGDVIDTIVSGTYHFMDNQTDISWSGAFDVEESSAETISPGKTKVTASGTFTVTPTDDDDDSTILGKFSIESQFNVDVDEDEDTVKISQQGTYCMTDSTTGASKTGTFVVMNTVFRPQPGGGTKTVKSGLLFVDETDDMTSSPVEQPLVPDNELYFLRDDYIYDHPDKEGNYGDGVYNVKDPKTNESLTGTYVIQEMSITYNDDETVEAQTKGVIFVDGPDPDSNPTGSLCSSTIRHGASFTIDDHMRYVTDSYGHVSLIGNSQLTQTDPETGETYYGNLVILNVAINEDDDGSTYVRKFAVIPIDDDIISTTTTQAPTEYTEEPCQSTTTTQAPTEYTEEPCESTTTTEEPCESTTTTQAPTEYTEKPCQSTTTTEEPCESTTTTQAPTIDPCPSEPYVLKKDHFEALLGSLNPINPTIDNFPRKDDGTVPYDPIAIVTNASYVIIEGNINPQTDADGNTVGLLNTGNYSIRDPQTNVSWTGSFTVEDCSINSPTKGQIDVTGSGTFDVNPSTSGSSGTPDSKIQATFSIRDHVSLTVDEAGTSRAAEDGTFSLTNPITGDSTDGTFVVLADVSNVNPDGSIHVVKSAILYLDEGDDCEMTPSDEPDSVKYGGYFLTNQHLLPVRNSDGNYGIGVLNIKDPETNEYTSATYVIENAFSVENPDGTTDVTTSGTIYVDSSRSSSPLISSEPALAIINGAKFTFVDHLSNVTDRYGHVNVVGTGEFTQTDPETKATWSGKYIIQDIITNDNPDGSQDAIQSGTFYYTTDSDSSINLSATSPKLDSDTSLTDLKTHLQALSDSLDVLKTQTANTYPLKQTSGDATLCETSGSTSTSGSNRVLLCGHVVLSRSSVVSAINGQCLSPGEVVVVQTNNGDAMMATILDSYSPVTFYPINLADLTGKIVTAKKVWTVGENDFSKQDRSIIDAVFKSA